jgi:hypothetical protein
MKKTLLFALVLSLAVMFAVPAFAFKIESGKDNSFYFGAAVFTDLAIWNRNKELVPGGKSDRTELIFDLPRHSRIRGSLDVGNVGAYWEVRLGGNQQDTNAGTPGWSTTGFYFAEGAKLYGYYKFGNCTFLAGKTDGHFYSVAAYQNIGYNNNNHIAGFGFGPVYDSRNAQVRFSQDVSKTFGYDISLVQPIYYQDNGTGIVAPTTLGAQQSLGTFPQLALKMRMNFGAVSLMPAGILQYVKWNDLPNVGGNNPDDNMTAWAVVLPIVVKAGAFTGTFQGSYGINEGGPSAQSAGYQAAQALLGFNSQWHQYRRRGGSIKNTTGYQGFMDLAFTSGAVTPHFYVGYDKAENDLYVGDKNNVRMMYGVGINWKIVDSFYVVPEFTYYDQGKDPTRLGNPELGKEWIGGVQFQFVF